MILEIIIVILFVLLVGSYLLWEKQDDEITTLKRKEQLNLNRIDMLDGMVDELKRQKSILFESEQAQEGKVEELLPYKKRAEYRRKRIINLEKKLAVATGNKKILRGTKLKK